MGLEVGVVVRWKRTTSYTTDLLLTTHLAHHRVRARVRVEVGGSECVERHALRSYTTYFLTTHLAHQLLAEAGAEGDVLCSGADDVHDPYLGGKGGGVRGKVKGRRKNWA